MEHRVNERTTTRRPDKSWGGTISCTCGWEGEAGDHPTEASAVVGLQAQWLLHAND